MNNLNLDMPKRIHEAVPANMKVGIDFDSKRYLLRDFDMNDLHLVWQDLPDGTLILDNRTPEEFARGHVPGSRNIPMGTENSHVEELRNFEQIYLYCRSGRRAPAAPLRAHHAGGAPARRRRSRPRDRARRRARHERRRFCRCRPRR